MSFVAVTIQKLFESGQSPSKICDHLTMRSSEIWCLPDSQAFVRDRLDSPKGEDHSKSQS